MADIGGRIVNGLALALVIIIALMLGIGMGSLLAWRGPIPEEAVILPLLVIGSILVVTTIVCYCLRAWVNEQ